MTAPADQHGVSDQALETDQLAPESLGYQPQLDGLRALAVFAVVAAHTGIPTFKGGYMGVDIFFVLSGFLITTLLVQEYDKSNTISLISFYKRRALRLLPALVVVLMFVGITFPTFRPYLVDQTLPGIPASLFFVSSWIRAFSISRLGWLGHTWSLSVEEHFYLVWPVLLLLTCKYARGKLLRLTCLLFVVSFAYRAVSDISGVSAPRLLNSPDMRAEQLLGGCLLAVFLLHVRPSCLRPAMQRAQAVIFGLCVVFLVGVMAIPNKYYTVRYFEGTPITYYYNGLSTLITVASAVIIGYLVVLRTGWIAILLSSKPLVWLGRRSYGIYLWHVPLFGLFFLKGVPNSVRFPVRFALIFVSVFAASLSYRYIETPFLRRGRSRDSGFAPHDGAK